jgi:hypothetical protein
LLHHLRVAVENLHAAGMRELAEKLAEQAKVMERGIHEAKEILSRGMRAHHDSNREHRDDSVEQFRREVQPLRGELKEIRQLILERL